jgi:hypothetical protein
MDVVSRDTNKISNEVPSNIQVRSFVKNDLTSDTLPL